MDLSIIIPTKDRGNIFDATLLKAARAVEGVSAEIIVVNDSKTQTPTMPNDPCVRLINNPKHGVASARNCGAQAASGEVILFLDDDILVSSESVRHILTIHREMDRIALNLDWVYPPEILQHLDSVSFGRFLIAHNLTTFRGWYADAGWKENQLFESLSVASFHLSLRRTDFERSGGYDEQFPHAGFEDFDFPLRLKNAGVNFLIDTRKRVYHNESDRTRINSWLNSQERRASTRAVAVDRGHPSLALKYTTIKKIILSLLLFMHPVIGFILYLLPNKKSFDPWCFKLVAGLQTARIYKGYSDGLAK